MDRKVTPEFIELDLTRMIENPRCAIRVSTLAEAQLVILNAKHQFPERVKNWNAETNNHWNVYEELTGFTLFYEDEDEPSTMSYADVPWFEANGYQIVEFNELVGAVSEISESEQPMSLLFGGAV